jgi:HAE1 family hydrophobic/amphiphilic exporter-1
MAHDRSLIARHERSVSFPSLRAHALATVRAMLSELCVRRPVFATVLVMSLVVLGAFSFRDLGVDLFPRADPATVNIALQLPGASPAEMSTSVVEPMEQALSSVAGIDEMQSRINEGTATITVKFVLERDISDASNDVREKVAGAMKVLPPQVLPPIIQKVDPDSDPVLSLALSSSSMSLRALTEIADKQDRSARHRAGDDVDHAAHRVAAVE